ncbi:DNA methyltransferase [Deinococcus planocerae]|uniref:DNA methyltransferase n=1 Tax=Deinococcus planocerae TaxID=1737569 RepID=UPI000C7EABBB|nr:DNA methyltransferase [Deinococcus planocerae]
MPVELIWEGKYDPSGKRVQPVRLALPFQTIETVNESSQQRMKMLDFFATGKETEWRNRLIWGDKKYVLPSLLEEFRGKVDLIYIDPPFATGADFSFTAQIPDDPKMEGSQAASFMKQPSILEQKAYRDTWGRGLDGFLQWFYETSLILKDLLSETGSIYIHLDWNAGYYCRAIMDDVFGRENFRNEIYWYYYNKMPDTRKGVFPRSTDVIYWYTRNKQADYTFNPLEEKREAPVKQLVRQKVDGKMVNARDDEGNVLYQVRDERVVDNVWRLSMLQPADKTENVNYPTQKPEALLERIIKASSNPGDLVLDCFCGSGTTAAVAEKLGRRWITCDLGRFAIHTTRKRLLSIPEVGPFVVQNLGKYERQAWQAAEWEDETAGRAREAAYRSFILRLYGAEELPGGTWTHGVKAGRLVHVGAVDAPVTEGDLKAITREVFKRAGGAGATAAVDVLGWDFAFELNETGKNMARDAGVDVRFRKIPREVLEKKAVEQGDIHFFELGALDVRAETKARRLTLTLTDFLMPQDDIPADVQKSITHWSQLVDYWAVDWDFRGDTFHNQWQAYRTRKQTKLELSARHEYLERGQYTVLVKVIDILGNDTTKTLTVEVI